MKKNSGRIVKLDKSKYPTILGLDISSATIGFGLIELNKNSVLLAHGHIKPLDSKHFELERLDDVFYKIKQLCKDLNPTYICVEDIFLFMKGNSTARTITLLTAFNRIISLSAYQEIKDIRFLNVHQIRKIIKSSFKIENIEKEDMPDLIRKYLDKRFKNIVNKKIAKETYDEADGIAAAWALTLLKLDNNLEKLLETKKGKK